MKKKKKKTNEKKIIKKKSPETYWRLYQSISVSHMPIQLVIEYISLKMYKSPKGIYTISKKEILKI